ncbi:MAG: PPOX class F420-dependent oxidoreductase [Acidimicrobiia bacterium]|nr:PPOX class F420-dependent oxidoreductase [Acidimicrobiia bacterium]
MKVHHAMEFVGRHHKGVLATVRSNGLPQMSNIVFSAIDGAVWVSVTDGRAKTANLRREPRAVLHVTTTEFTEYAVMECDAELTDVALDPTDATIAALRRLYRNISGEHPDWDEFDRAMIDDCRLVVKLYPVHCYGQLEAR